MKFFSFFLFICSTLSFTQASTDDIEKIKEIADVHKIKAISENISLRDLIKKSYYDGRSFINLSISDYAD